MQEFLGKYGKVIATSLALVAMIGVGSSVFAGDVEGGIGGALKDKVSSVAGALGLGGGVPRVAKNFHQA